MAAPKPTKKRLATSQGGPKPKKAHVDKSSKSAKPSDKKRSRPVTVPVKDESESDSEVEDIEDEAAEDEADGGEENDSPMETDDPPPIRKDPAGACRAFSCRLDSEISLQLLARHIKPRSFCKNNDGVLSRTRRCSSTPSVSGVWPTPKTSIQMTDKNTSRTS